MRREPTPLPILRTQPGQYTAKGTLKPPKPEGPKERELRAWLKRHNGRPCDPCAGI